MADGTFMIQANTLLALADAIRNKSGGVDAMSPSQMIAAIENMQLGVDTSDATASAAQILTGYSAYANGEKVDGSMVNRGAVNTTLSGGGTYTIPAGYHNGSGKVKNGVSGISKAQLVQVTLSSKTQSITFNHSLGAAPSGIILGPRATLTPLEYADYYADFYATSGGLGPAMGGQGILLYRKNNNIHYLLMGTWHTLSSSSVTISFPSTGSNDARYTKFAPTTYECLIYRW